MIKKIIAFFTAAATFLCVLLNIPCYAGGKEIDLDKFTLTWEDDFNGDRVDESVWGGHYVWGGTEIRRGGYWNKQMASVADGCLTIRTEYLPEGLDGGPAGFYSYGLDTRKAFEQKYGYFETRCILPKGHDLWGAFWLLCDGAYDVGNGGADGAELDVFESLYTDAGNPNMVSSNIHYDGYGDAHKALGSKKFLLRGNPYEEFNTYGMEWNENEYTFYINGKKSFSTDFGGVSAVPEWLILSVEVGGKDGEPTCNTLEGVESSAFIVDYVRAYAYK